MPRQLQGPCPQARSFRSRRVCGITRLLEGVLLELSFFRDFYALMSLRMDVVEDKPSVGVSPEDPGADVTGLHGLEDEKSDPNRPVLYTPP